MVPTNPDAMPRRVAASMLAGPWRMLSTVRGETGRGTARAVGDVSGDSLDMLMDASDIL